MPLISICSSGRRKLSCDGMVLVGAWMVFSMVGSPSAWGEEDPKAPSWAIEREIQDLTSQEAGQPADPFRLTRIAGLYLKLGNQVDRQKDERLAAYHEGAKAALRALELREDLADAHFYYAANVGSAAHLSGMLAALLNVQALKTHVTRALELQDDHAPALHMMGMMLEKLPWFLGGDPGRALGYLERAVAVNAHYWHARLDLAKMYIDRERYLEAGQQLRHIVAETRPSTEPRDHERFRLEAQQLLEELPPVPASIHGF